MRYVIHKFSLDNRPLERNWGGTVEERRRLLPATVICKCRFLLHDLMRPRAHGEVLAA